jgi:hypothetical protein
MSRKLAPIQAGKNPTTRKPRRSGAFIKCAEEDSNLHPVIPDQALKHILRPSITSAWLYSIRFRPS